jgi:two-component system response regulator YesN
VLKLLIADDEEITRDSLIECIPWNDLGVELMPVARNGVDALNAAKHTKPDILLTDVRMPKMDGIELATRLQSLCPECKIIFVSGYAEKDYLKQAIRLRAVSYIEKPINIKELKSVVLSTVQLCQEEASSELEAVRLKNSVAESESLFRREAALALVSGTRDFSSIAEKFDRVISGFTVSPWYTAVFIKLNWKPGTDAKTKSRVKDEVLETLPGLGPANAPRFLHGFVDADSIVLIAAASLTPHGPDGRITVQRILDHVNGIPDAAFQAVIGVGSPVRSLAQLPESFEGALKAVSSRFYGGADGVHFHGSVESRRFVVPEETFETFRRLLKRGAREESGGLIAKVTDEVQESNDSDIDHIKNLYFRLLLVVFEVSEEVGLIDPYAHEEKGYIWQEISSRTTLTELQNYICANMDLIFNRIDELNAVGRKVFEVMRFIRENYADKMISVQSVAESSTLSPTYLCSFFKKNTGKTLHEFITEVRMKHAIELLKNPDWRVYEIADKIGFTDANYFSVLFRKYTGHTPTEYRERHIP